MDDTHPKIAERMFELYRRMTPAEKAERVRQLTQTVQQLALAEIARTHPHDSPREHMLRFASRHLPAELMLKAFCWDVDLRGR